MGKVLAAQMGRPEFRSPAPMQSWTQWHESLFLEFLQLEMEAETREPWMLTGRLACYMQIGATKRLSQTKWKVPAWRLSSDLCMCAIGCTGSHSHTRTHTNIYTHIHKHIHTYTHTCISHT